MSIFDEDLFLKGLEQRKATLGADYVEQNLAGSVRIGRLETKGFTTVVHVRGECMKLHVV